MCAVVSYPDLHHLFLDLLLFLVFRDGADKKATVVQTHTYPYELSRADFVVVQELDSSLGSLSGGVHDEGVATVLSAKLHHQTELVDATGPLNTGTSSSSYMSLGIFTHKHLTTSWRRRALQT